STIGLPLVSVSSSESALARSRTSCASLNRIRPRSCAVVSFQGPPSNAVRAAATARSTSATFASGTVPMTFSVAGSIPSIGSVAATDIGVAVINGARPGPVLAVVSGAHGTEYASILAVEELIDAVDPAQLSGTLILVPLVNVASFERLVPHVNPIDNKSMNR